MSSWQKLLKLFYKYNTEILLYTEAGKLKGFIFRDDLMEDLSDLDNVNSELFSFVTKVNDIDQVLQYLGNSQLNYENKKALPVIDEKFVFIKLWSSLDIVKAWQGESASVEPTTNEKITESKTRDKISLDEKLAALAIETLPIGMLALDTLGKQLFYNEDWLALKKKYPNELTTKKIIQKAKNFMAQEAYKTNISLTATFILDSIIPEDSIKMRLIRYKNITIGYLFWYPEAFTSKKSTSSTDENKFYEGKSLKNILDEKEKQILMWAMEKANGKVIDAAEILGVPRQTFSYRYDRLHGKKSKSKTKSNKD